MYQVIARKYRPQTFDEVVGQGHVKQTVRNAIEQGRIAHGYIFSGPRGTGKTTMARILAMALNCEGGPSSSPDPASPVCSEIAAGGSLDVIEIDAASNRRIDDIRDLRESVRFRPVRDRYKVFIIDEAHQITGDAFNALLKTLEEPPEWTVFVLCTTEPQAIPATIVSRCQSLAFRAVDQAAVLDHLRTICQSEGVEADDDALVALALAGDGSIRDSLSALDQAIAAFGQHLETASVRALLGAIPGEVTARILLAIRDSDPAAMLAVADDLFLEGRHPQHFCGELTRQFRNLLVMKVAGVDSKLVAAGQGERQAAEKWLAEFSNEDLTRYVQILLTLYQDLQQATQQRFRLELGLLKLVYAGRLRPIEQILSGLRPGAAGQPTVAARKAEPSPAPDRSSPERKAGGSPGASQPASRSPEPAARTPPSSVPTREAGSSETRPETPRTSGDSPAEIFRGKLLAAIRETDDQFLLDGLEHSRLERDGRVVTVHVKSEWKGIMEFQRPLLEAALVSLVGGRPDVRLVDEADESGPASQAAANDGNGAETDPVSERAQSDPAFLEFKRRIDGHVTRVTDLRGQKGEE